MLVLKKGAYSTVLLTKVFWSTIDQIKIKFIIFIKWDTFIIFGFIWK
jgi:hypothetical protein